MYSTPQSDHIWLLILGRTLINQKASRRREVGCVGPLRFILLGYKLKELDLFSLEKKAQGKHNYIQASEVLSYTKERFNKNRIISGVKSLSFSFHLKNLSGYHLISDCLPLRTLLCFFILFSVNTEHWSTHHMLIIHHYITTKCFTLFAWVNFGGR